MIIEEPTLPAIIPPSDILSHAAELEAAYALFKEELASTEGWIDQGETNGVQIYSKPDPEDSYGIPTVKGEALIEEDVTSEELLAVIQLPGLRKRWDPRFEQGLILQRYNRLSYSFYSVMKGLSWIVYPRDIVGVQRNYRKDEENQEIFVIQTSVQEDELAPEQSGKTRATLTVSGWHLKPQADGLKVTYIVKISLNGSIPSAMVNKIAMEIPSCIGRVRDLYEQLGHAPYVRPSSDQTEPTVVFQTEHFSDPGPSAEDHGALVYDCTFTTSDDGKFEVVYSSRMYPGGVQVKVEGAGAEAKDEGDGMVKVTCSEGGKVATLFISPQ